MIIISRRKILLSLYVRAKKKKAKNMDNHAPLVRVNNRAEREMRVTKR